MDQKWQKIVISGFYSEKASLSRSKVFLVQLSGTLLRVFCIFESRDYAIRPGKNLPIASEIIDVKLSLIYVMLYIIFKHFLS